MRVFATYRELRNSWVHAFAILALVVSACNFATYPAGAADDAAVTVPRFVPQVSSPGDAPRPGSIRFVTSDDFPPFNFLDGAGRLTGFNVELARAICNRLQVPCTIQVRAFSGLVDAVNGNEADAIIAGLKDTPKLRRYVAHTYPYLRLPARFAMAREKAIAPTPETMANRVVGVVGGTRYDAFLADFFPSVQRRETETLDEALSLLAKGDVDAVFDGALPLVFWLSGPEGSKCCALAGGAYTEPAYFGSGLTIAVARGNEPLRRALNDTLRSLEADGVLADLNLRFFPSALY